MMKMYPTEMWIAYLSPIVILIIIGIVVIIPYLPHIFARFSHKKLLFMIDKGGGIKIVKAKLVGDMYQLKKDNLLFLKQYPGSYKFAGVDMDFVHADRTFVIKPEFQAAIQELKEQYDINTYNELRTAIKSGRVKMGEDIEVPLFFKVPFDAMVDYGAWMNPSSMQAQVDDMYMMNKSAENVGAIMKFLPYAIFLVIIIIGAALAWKIMS